MKKTARTTITAFENYQIKKEETPHIKGGTESIITEDISDS